MSDSSEPVKPLALQLSKNPKDLKACSECGLLLASSDWKARREQCPNECEGPLTKNYDSVACIMKPTKSWVMRVISTKDNLHPGIYGLNPQAE